MQERPEDFAALTRNRLLPGAFVSAAKYIRAQQLRAALCREFADAMRDLDAVVTLSSLLLPCRIDDPAAIAKTYDQQCRLVFNVTGTPAISVPTGFTAAACRSPCRSPATPSTSRWSIAIAQAYEAATGFADRRPPIKLRENAPSPDPLRHEGRSSRLEGKAAPMRPCSRRRFAALGRGPQVREPA